MKKNRDWSLLGLNLCIGIETGLLVSILMAGMLFVGNYGADDLEHWASSWFVFNGYTPYKDFFQHHHPLLWYMTAPVFWFIDHPIDSFQVGRVIAAIFFFWGCLLIGKIIKALGNGARSFLYVLFIYLSYPVTTGSYIQNRPDTYMVPFLLWGFYKWILFFKEKKTKDLIWCYLFFFIAFAFLQKAVWLLAPFGVYQLYLLVRKELKWTDVFKALTIPLVCSGAYFLYLVLTGSFMRYWELNWILNIYFFRDYQSYQMNILDYVYTGLCILVCLWNIKNEKGVIRDLLFVILGFASIFYFIPKPYYFYWIIWVPFAAIVVGLGLGKLVISKELLKSFFARGVLILACFLTGVHICTNALWVEKSNFEKEVRLLSTKIKEGNELVDYDDYRAQFLRNYPKHYYWFCLVRCGPLDVKLFHRYQMPDWDKIIYEQKPKYVMYHKVYDLTEADDRNTDKQIMGVDENWLIKHYRYLDKMDVYERVE
ncbi:MAG: glycosyltransferase family 39 protein [Alphaproteobacteria bacterium]|nr:glycosyltransferase family 39 protein [Alphaproteobacteria bacterium]